MKRVVITGMGLVTPLGNGVKTNWRRLVNSESGIKAITRFDVSEMPAKIAGQVPLGTNEGEFDFDQYCSTKDRRKMDDFIVFGLAAAEEAVKDSGWMPTETEQRNRTGVMIGSGIGGLPALSDWAVTLKQHGPRRVSPFFIPSCLINLVSGQVSIRWGFSGPNHAVVTACASGAHAIGDAARLIMFDDADVMVAGGAEAAICPLGVAGFSAARALSTSFNDQPTKASRPWDQDRDGFVMGEGAGIVVLEELEHAKKRGAKIYGELIGYGLSGDAFHMTLPAEDGNGGYRAMQAALKRAQLEPSAIDYVNAHGTSTPPGDKIELAALKRLFEQSIDQISVSSTKSAIGHLLGAAGAVEAVYSIMAMNHHILPPTLNLDNPSEDCRGIDLVPHRAREKKISTVMSNSFGFGGTNASLIFTSFK